MLQNLAYALIQVVHNLGAVAAVGVAASGVWMRVHPPPRRLALLMAAVWALQALTGALFGATSYHFYGHFPDIHGIAVDALVIKAGCAIAGFVLAAAAYLRGQWAERHAFPIWLMLFVLAVTALSSAAFLRWFS